MNGGVCMVNFAVFLNEQTCGSAYLMSEREKDFVNWKKCFIY